MRSSPDTKLVYTDAAAFANSVASKFTGLGGALSCAAATATNFTNTTSEEGDYGVGPRVQQ